MIKYPVHIYLLHLGLFGLTLMSATLVGAELINGYHWSEGLTWAQFWTGLPYSLAFMTFLTFHEFGHFFAAVSHDVRTSLPYYLPLYIPVFLLNIGSLGAVIVLKGRPTTTQKFFDIGIAGPLAGFLVSTGLLIYGFMNLPELESYVLRLHPEYIDQFGGMPASISILDSWLKEQGNPGVMIGSSLLFELLKNLLPIDTGQIPPHFELMHYPYLFVGYITLFFTALNLLPIGQLDGGHITYGLFGRRWASRISRATVIALLLIGGTGLVDLPDGSWETYLSRAVYLGFLVYIYLYLFSPEQWHWVVVAIVTTVILQAVLKGIMPQIRPSFIWLMYAFLAVRFIKLDHPPALVEHELDPIRKWLGWLAILIFVLCFTPEPIRVIGATN